MVTVPKNMENESRQANKHGWGGQTHGWMMLPSGANRAERRVVETTPRWTWLEGNDGLFLDQTPQGEAGAAIRWRRSPDLSQQACYLEGQKGPRSADFMLMLIGSGRWGKNGHAHGEDRARVGLPTFGSKALASGATSGRVGVAVCEWSRYGKDPASRTFIYRIRNARTPSDLRSLSRPLS
ncbi:hypothetical protein BJY01DRAFT_170907 [Aspergillus pseudoustus]|uniref:Uncharacterized protein n=1 Tax=Aspergillus pseudoustus TaxID=1810923 RepID=A0ABR4KWK6_9EURO